MAPALEEVLAPGFLADLPGRPVDELRRLRLQCQEVETGLSLLRRVVQGHLDIIGAEVRRRAEGDPGDRADLLARLPEVLADRTQASGRGRLSALMVPEALDPELEAELDALVGAGAAVDPSTAEDESLQVVAEGLRALETKLSAARQSLFGRLDELEQEIARRYRTGEASVDSLL